MPNQEIFIDHFQVNILLADLKARDPSFKADYDTYIAKGYSLGSVPVVPNGTRLISF